MVVVKKVVAEAKALCLPQAKEVSGSVETFGCLIIRSHKTGAKISLQDVFTVRNLQRATASIKGQAGNEFEKQREQNSRET